MEERKVSLDDILVPGEKEIRDNNTLKLYHRMYDKGCDEAVPPVIVTGPGRVHEYKTTMDDHFAKKSDNPRNSFRLDRSIEQRREGANQVFRKVEEYGLWLLDGTHRSVAAGLNGREEIRALELEEDSDINELEQMIQSGEILSFPHSDESLDNLRQSFISYAMGYDASSLPPNGLTLGTDSKVRMKGSAKDYVDTLVEEQKVPGYMIENME